MSESRDPEQRVRDMPLGTIFDYRIGGRFRRCLSPEHAKGKDHVYWAEHVDSGEPSPFFSHHTGMVVESENAPQSF